MLTILKRCAVCVTVLLFALTAYAELSPEFADWAEGPEGFFLTEDEADAWEEVTTDAEAKDFIALFWAKRDPNPGAAYNEFKARVEGMIKYCDENFSYEGKRGALSDMGRVFLLLGPPHQAQSRGPTQTVDGTNQAGGAGGSYRGTDQVTALAKMWTYDPARLDEKFKVKGSRLLFVFYEERPNTNEYVLDRSHREATMAMRVLNRAPDVYVLNPDLETVPKPVSVPGGEPASQGQLEALNTMLGAGSPEGVRFMAALGVADATHRPLWIHAGASGEIPVVDTLAGRVLDETGEEVLSTFQTSAEPLETLSGSAYHLTLPLTVGSYTYEIGGFADGEPAFAYSQAVDVPADSESGWLSPLWAGVEVVEDPDAMIGEAFSFGGWHLIPLDVVKVPKDRQLSYFGFVVNPSIPEGAEAQAELKLTLRKNGQRLGQPLKMPLPLAPVTDGVYFYGNAINLAALPPGACTLDFKVSFDGIEEDSRQKVELEIIE